MVFLQKTRLTKKGRVIGASGSGRAAAALLPAALLHNTPVLMAVMANSSTRFAVIVIGTNCFLLGCFFKKSVKTPVPHDGNPPRSISFDETISKYSRFEVGDKIVFPPAACELEGSRKHF